MANYFLKKIYFTKLSDFQVRYRYKIIDRITCNIKVKKRNLGSDFLLLNHVAKSTSFLNLPLVIFRKEYKKHNFRNEFNMFIILRHVFYATLGLTIGGNGKG